MRTEVNRLYYLVITVLAAIIFVSWSIVAGAVEPAPWKKPGMRAAKRSEQQSSPKPSAAESPSPRIGKREPHAGRRATPVNASGDLSPGQVDSKEAVLMDVTNGVTLFEQNADDPIEPASFTKILSLYLVFEALQQGKIHLTDQVPISEVAWRTGGSKMFVGVGTQVPLEELLKGIAVVSGNDACVAVAEYVYGSIDTFVDAMNRKAQELGMTKSHFVNPHGLPAEGQVTTARDMATLDAAYIRRFPEALKYHSMHDFTYNNITQYNRNHLLLKDSTVDGLKTGYVEGSRYHLSATAKRGGFRLLAVVMGAAAPVVREREAMKLLNYGYRNFTMVQPLEEGKPAKTVKVWKGVKDELEVYPAESPSFTIGLSQKNALRWEVHVPEELTAPVQSGQVVGDMVFYVADQPRKTLSLVSREDIEQAGWFKRTWQSLLRVGSIDWRWAAGLSLGVVLIGALGVLITNRRSRTSRSMGI